MSEPSSGEWRDEKRIPLAELTKAMAGFSFDAQVDDTTGGDASAEDAFGHEAWTPDEPSGDHDPDADTEEGRRLRPSPEGRSGPV
jgi:hypothetical protein